MNLLDQDLDELENEPSRICFIKIAHCRTCLKGLQGKEKKSLRGEDDLMNEVKGAKMRSVLTLFIVGTFANTFP